MFAEAIKIDHMYCVVLGGKVITRYSSPANAKYHSEAINMAIHNPPNLNQKPHR